MENEDLSVLYDLKQVVKSLEKSSGQKAVVDRIFNTTYLMGNMTEDDLLDAGFKCFGPTHKGGFDTYIYRLGKNIEACFIEQILHITEITA